MRILFQWREVIKNNAAKQLQLSLFKTHQSIQCGVIYLGLAIAAGASQTHLTCDYDC
ncbi:hypothetical protein GMES_0004 [Paraglaciecola mesophila KMM 241]|uniref:Uncharacterized protein n=1 Tax=Paraglaciecola mesophila KMM 241 TaxID=1128912 RepID=K6XNX3_9ALTE|nr:hypothetical protein GMES_0004 [Paraglaciecola mesophila KMM 241]